MRPVRPALGLVLLSGPFILACGAEQAAPRVPVTHVVEIRDMGFHPRQVAAHPGDTIVWVNRDFVPHTATDPDSVWTTPPLAQGESWRSLVTPSMDGRYICAFHPTREATVDLDPSAPEEDPR